MQIINYFYKKRGFMLKRTIFVTAIIMMTFLVTDCAQSQESGAKDMKTFQDSVAYAIGISTAKNFQQNDLEIDLDLYFQGLKDGMGDSNAAKLNEQQMMAILQKFQQDLQAEAQKKQNEAATSNLAESEKFLAENAKKPGVKVTDSGLQYEVIKEGTGAMPTATDKVKVHYHGTLPNGEVFDSSVDRGEPASFGLNQVIAGWTEGLQLMKEGAKYKFYIPPSIGYGERGAGAMIGPNQALVFEVELLEIIKE